MCTYAIVSAVVIDVIDVPSVKAIEGRGVRASVAFGGGRALVGCELSVRDAALRMVALHCAMDEDGARLARGRC